MEIKTENNPSTKEEISNFEKEINVELPNEYKTFLLKYNGGKPSKYVFPDTEDLYSFAISDLYGLNTKQDYNDLRRSWNLFKDRIFKQFISIGRTIDGDQITLGISGPLKGKVYFWDHNTELENDEFTENVLPGNMYLLADSFNEFLNKLEEDTEV